MAKITLIGMMNFLEQRSDDLFLHLSLPEGMNKQTLIDTIVMHGAEFEMLYGDPYFIQRLIKTWSEKHEHTFERWIKALSIDYEPLWNYDRTEEWADTGNRSGSHNEQKTGSENRIDSSDHTVTDSGAHTETLTHVETGSASEDLQRSEDNSVVTAASETTANDNKTTTTSAGSKSHDETVEQTISAFDSSTYQPDTKTVTDFNDAETSKTDTGSSGTSALEGNSSSASKLSGNDKKETSDERSSTDSRTINNDQQSSDSSTSAGSTTTSEQLSGNSEETSSSLRHGRAFGNIGVMSSQELLEREFNVAKLNIYEEASDLFLTEFCIYVY